MLLVAVGTKAGSQVVFGPNPAKIVTDPAIVASIERQLREATGINIGMVKGQHVLQATEVEGSTEIAALMDGSYVLKAETAKRGLANAEKQHEAEQTDMADTIQMETTAPRKPKAAPTPYTHAEGG